MKRRDVLKRAAALGAAGALAGCISESDDGGDGGSNPNGGDGGSNQDDGDGSEPNGTTTTPVTPSVAGSEFLDSAAGCGEGNDAEISFDEGALVVAISGTLTAPDPCHNPEFAEASYDVDADELSVGVRPVEDESVDMCTECVAKMEYDAEVRFEGALPGSVSVSHIGMGGGETVATESR